MGEQDRNWQRRGCSGQSCEGKLFYRGNIWAKWHERTRHEKRWWKSVLSRRKSMCQREVWEVSWQVEFKYSSTAPYPKGPTTSPKHTSHPTPACLLSPLTSLSDFFKSRQSRFDSAFHWQVSSEQGHKGTCVHLYVQGQRKCWHLDSIKKWACLV